MVEFKSLMQGAKVVGLVILAIIGAYAVAILGGIVIGVLVDVAVGSFNGSSGSGDISISNAMMTAIQGYEGTYISTITTSLTPLVTIAALVVVVVLILIFFGKGGFSLGKKGVE